jgi:hypothetical protein
MTLDPSTMVIASNWSDAGTLTAGSQAGALVVDNLKDRNSTKVWRSVGLAPAATTITVDMGRAKVVDVVYLRRVNISQAGRWRVRISNDAAFAVASSYDSGWVRAWPVLAGHGALPWGIWLWGDVISEAEAAYYVIDATCVLPATVSGRYVRIDIDDQTNAAGFVQAGRLVVGPAWRVAMDYGWDIGWSTAESNVDYSIGGQTWIDQRPQRRTLRFGLSAVPEVEIYVNAFDYLDRRKSIAGDVLIIPQPAKPELYIHEVIYGRLQRLDPVGNPAPGPSSSRTKSFAVEEML